MQYMKMFHSLGTKGGLQQNSYCQTTTGHTGSQEANSTSAGPAPQGYTCMTFLTSFNDIHILNITNTLFGVVGYQYEYGYIFIFI